MSPEERIAHLEAENASLRRALAAIAALANQARATAPEPTGTTPGR